MTPFLKMSKCTIIYRKNEGISGVIDAAEIDVGETAVIKNPLEEIAWVLVHGLSTVEVNSTLSDFYDEVSDGETLQIADRKKVLSVNHGPTIRHRKHK